LQYFILVEEGRDSKLAAAIGRDWKGRISPLLYLAGTVLALFQPWLAGAIYVVVALIWLVPDRRIERVVDEG